MTVTRVVVGESDPSLRYLLAAALVAAGHDVVDVEDGVALLELFGEAWAPDAVVVDADLPRLSGLDVLAELHDASPPVPVIVMTSQPGRDVRVQARRLGAFALLEKPINAELLVEVVRRATRSPLVVPHHVALGLPAAERWSGRPSAEADVGQFDPRGR